MRRRRRRRRIESPGSIYGLEGRDAYRNRFCVFTIQQQQLLLQLPSCTDIEQKSRTLFISCLFFTPWENFFISVEQGNRKLSLHAICICLI
jgi:hypothetical protein